MSAATESLAQKWLRQNVQPYAFKDAVYAHVDAVLSQFSTIRPKTDVYTYDDGRTQLLLCLHGLLPIAYRGTSYNIPIAIWISRDYPRQPPIAYVVPTSDMLVRASKYVDVSGRCSVEYLQNWQRKSEGCNLTGLLEVMQQHFSREPPVYSKPKTPDPPQSRQLQRPESGNDPYSARPPPPLPSTSTPSPLSQPAPIPPLRNDHRTPLPLKPGQQVLSVSPSVISAINAPSDVNLQPPFAHGTPAQTMISPPPPIPPLPASDPNLPQYRNSPGPLPPYNAIHDRTLSGGGALPPSSGAPHSLTSQWGAPNTPSRTFSSDVGQNRPSIPPYSSSSSTPLPLPLTASPTRPPPPPPSVSASQGPAHPPPPPHLPRPTTSPLGVSQPRSSPPPPLPPLPPLNYNQHHQSLSPQPTGSIPLQPNHVVHPTQWPPSAPIPTLAPTPRPPPPPPPSIPPPDLLDAEDGLSAPPSSIPQPPMTTPAPPCPPNPELLHLHNTIHAKLTSELASLRQAMSLDVDRLRATQADLLAGEPAIRDEMARLEAVRDVCKGVCGRVGGVVGEVEERMRELRRKGDPAVDELVCSTTIVHDQLINLVAEDNAIEDTIYHLHRALNTGRIDLERFLRTTRVLAEEQFMKRALIEKIQGGIPMGSEANLVHVRSREWS